jgi:hypothetical protein
VARRSAKPETAKTLSVLPVQLRPGDTFTDMDSWAGVGAVAVGMAAQGFDLQLTQNAGANWRATFVVTGMPT